MIFFRNRNYPSKQWWRPPHFIGCDDDTIERKLQRFRIWPGQMPNGTTWSGTIARRKWKKTSDCLNLSLAFFGAIFSRCRGNNIVNVPGVAVLCEQSEIRISFQCKRLRIRTIKKVNESGNIYESGKVCSSVNLVLIDSPIACINQPRRHFAPRFGWSVLSQAALARDERK